MENRSIRIHDNGQQVDSNELRFKTFNHLSFKYLQLQGWQQLSQHGVGHPSLQIPINPRSSQLQLDIKSISSNEEAKEFSKIKKLGLLKHCLKAIKNHIPTSNILAIVDLSLKEEPLICLGLCEMILFPRNSVSPSLSSYVSNRLS